MGLGLGLGLGLGSGSGNTAGLLHEDDDGAAPRGEVEREHDAQGAAWLGWG